MIDIMVVLQLHGAAVRTIPVRVESGTSVYGVLMQANSQLQDDVKIPENRYVVFQGKEVRPEEEGTTPVSIRDVSVYVTEREDNEVYVD